MSLWSCHTGAGALTPAAAVPLEPSRTGLCWYIARAELGQGSHLAQAAPRSRGIIMSPISNELSHTILFHNCAEITSELLHSWAVSQLSCLHWINSPPLTALQIGKLLLALNWWWQPLVDITPDKGWIHKGGTKQARGDFITPLIMTRNWNLRVVDIWNFPVTFGPWLTTGNWNDGKQNHG